MTNTQNITTKRETAVLHDGTNPFVVGQTLTGMTHIIFAAESNPMPTCNVDGARRSPQITTARTVQPGDIITGHLCKKCFKHFTPAENA